MPKNSKKKRDAERSRLSVMLLLTGGMHKKSDSDSSILNVTKFDSAALA